MSAGHIGGFNCPHCGQHYSLAPHQVSQYAGQTISCTVCKRQFTVPLELAPTVFAPQPMMAQPVDDPHVAQPYAAEAQAAQMHPAHQYQRPRPQAYSPPGQTPYAATGSSPPAYPPQAYSPPPYQQGGYPQYAAPPGYGMGPIVGPATSSMAIASLICGLLFFIPFAPAILSLIFGFLGLRNTRDGQMGGRGLAVGGMICGVLSLMLWGTCFLGPMSGFGRGLRQARQQARQVQCSNNLRQIGQGLIMYAATNQGQFPTKLSMLIEHAGLPPQIFVCPHTSDTPAQGADAKAQAKDMERGGHLSYVYVGQGLTQNSPADSVLAYEKVGNHGNQGTNVLFLDGHVEWYDATATTTLLAELNAGNNPPQTKAGNAGQ
jgi:prepilin-type processing-associated H-X9-DG protein